MKKQFLFAALFFVSIAHAQEINIIPKPVEMKQPKIAASFVLSSATQIVSLGNETDNSINFFNNYLKKFYHLKLKVVKASGSSNVIRLNYKLNDNIPEDGYTMTIDNKGVSISGSSKVNLFYAVQTLIQFLPVNQQPETGNQFLEKVYVEVHSPAVLCLRSVKVLM